MHCLVEKGDSHAKVLERLVQLKNPDNSPVFDLNKKNNHGYTPLHIACKVHTPDALVTYEVTKILLKNGADPTVKVRFFSFFFFAIGLSGSNIFFLSLRL